LLYRQVSFLLNSLHQPVFSHCINIKQIILHLRNKGIGILITDHNVRETLTICDSAYIVNEGSIIAQGTAEIILAHQKVREVYLGNEFYL